jgi:NAD(P)H-hydrate epimerase
MTGMHPGKRPYERAHAVLRARINGTVLLKGPIDVICDGSRVRFNQTGTPAMTTGGTGDVLAGVCTSLMVTLPAFDAACMGHMQRDAPANWSHRRMDMG